MLAVCGQIDLRAGGPSFVPPASPEALEGLSKKDAAWSTVARPRTEAAEHLHVHQAVAAVAADDDVRLRRHDAALLPAERLDRGAAGTGAAEQRFRPPTEQGLCRPIVRREVDQRRSGANRPCLVTRGRDASRATASAQASLAHLKVAARAVREPGSCRYRGLLPTDAGNARSPRLGFVVSRADQSQRVSSTSIDVACPTTAERQHGVPPLPLRPIAARVRLGDGRRASSGWRWRACWRRWFLRSPRRGRRGDTRPIRSRPSRDIFRRQGQSPASF